MASDGIETLQKLMAAYPHLQVLPKNQRKGSMFGRCFDEGALETNRAVSALANALS